MIGSSDPKISYPVTAREEAELLRSTLRELFTASGLARLRAKHPGHKASQADAILETLLDGRGLEYDTELEAVRSLASLTLDAESWLSARRRGFKIDHDTWRQILARVQDSDQFDNTLAELFVWGALRSNSQTVVDLLQREGQPDLVMGEEGSRCGVEVKRVRKGWSCSSLRNAVVKANQQLRRFRSDLPGYLVMIVERDPDRASLDDRVPEDVALLEEEISKLIHPGIYRSVGSVLIAWDEFQVVGGIEDTGGIYTFRRKVVSVIHPAPISALIVQIDPSLFEFVQQRSMSYRDLEVDFEMPPVSIGTLDFGTEFRELDERIFGVRPSHVVDALASATARAEIRSNDGRAMLLVTREVRDGPGGGHTLLLVVFPDATGLGRHLVHNAFKLLSIEGHPSSKDPVACFLWFLNCYGLDVLAGSLVGRFLHEVNIVSDGTIDVLGLAEPPDPQYRFGMVGFFKFEEHPVRYATVTFAFAIDYARYRASYSKKAGVSKKKARRSGDPSVRNLK